MSQGLYSSASGIRANQTRLNVISNNIANVNTTGFKSADVTFANVFARTVSGGTGPNGILGGTNPKQIGNGVLVQSMPADFSQGGTQFTGRSTDMMINGNGFFVVERVDSNAGATAGLTSAFFLTRAGNFSLDSLGNMVTASGNRVRGTSQLSGSGPTTLSTVQIPQQIVITKDLDAADNIIGTHFASVGVTNAAILAQATAGTVTQNTVTANLTGFTVGTNGSVTATYSNGDRISVRVDPDTVSATNSAQARTEIVHDTAEGLTFAPDLASPGNGAPDGLPSTATDAGLLDQIAGFAVFTAPAGGVALQGMQLQMQLATVTNPEGLMYDGNNNFLPGANSGTTFFGTAGSENRGEIQVGSLESSNVDLAAQFTNMVITQRGLEANSRMMKANSEVLQTIINSV